MKRKYTWYMFGDVLYHGGMLLFIAGIPFMILGGLIMLFDSKNKPHDLDK